MYHFQTVIVRLQQEPSQLLEIWYRCEGAAVGSENVQLADLNSKTHGGKSLRDIIGRSIGILLYLPPES